METGVSHSRSRLSSQGSQTLRVSAHLPTHFPRTVVLHTFPTPPCLSTLPLMTLLTTAHTSTAALSTSPHIPPSKPARLPAPPPLHPPHLAAHDPVHARAHRPRRLEGRQVGVMTNRGVGVQPPYLLGAVIQLLAGLRFKPYSNFSS